MAVVQLVKSADGVGDLDGRVGGDGAVADAAEEHVARDREHRMRLERLAADEGQVEEQHGELAGGTRRRRRGQQVEDGNERRVRPLR